MQGRKEDLDISGDPAGRNKRLDASHELLKIPSIDTPEPEPGPSSSSPYLLKSPRYLPSPAFSSSSFGTNLNAAELRQ